MALVAACGSDGSTSDSAESPERDATTASTTSTTSTTVEDGAEDAVKSIAAGIVQEMGASQQDAECAATAIVEELGVERALEIDSSLAAFKTVNEAEQVVVSDAFNDCIPGSVVAEDIVTSFYESVGTTLEPDPTILECTATEMDGRVGTVAFEGLNATGPDSDLTATIDVLDACVPHEAIVDVLTSAFLDSGATPAQASCTAERVAAELTVRSLIEMGDDVPPEFEAKTMAAIEACRSAG